MASPCTRSPASSAFPSRCHQPSLRDTNWVRSSSATESGRERRAHRCSGGTTTTSSSCMIARLRKPWSCRGVSMNPKSASPARTAAMTRSLSVAVNVTSGATVPWRCAAVRMDTIQPGSRCSAMVRLAAIFSLPRAPARNAARPASRRLATSSNCSAHSATRAPDAVKVDPRAERVTNRTPTRDSIDRSRAETACWESPNSRPAPPRLPVLAIAASTWRSASSGIRALSGIPLIVASRRSPPAGVTGLGESDRDDRRMRVGEMTPSPTLTA